MLRNPWAYDQQQIAQQRAYEVDHPAEYHDFGDHGHLLSCDSIESVEETRPERHLRWLREAYSDPYAGVSDEDDDGGPTCVSKINATLEAPRVVYMNANTMEV